MFPQQKPPDLDVYGNPTHQGTQKPPDLDDYGNPAIPEEEGFAGQVWKAINEPLTDLPSRAGRFISGQLEKIPAMQQTGQGGLRDWAAWADAASKGFFQGATEGAGHVGDTFTSPLGAAGLLLTGGSNTALRAGLPQVANAMRLANVGVGSMFAGHGALETAKAAPELFDPDIPLSESASHVGQGLVEFAGGATGALHKPHTEGPILSRIWPDTETKVRKNVAPLLDQLRESLDRDRTKGGQPQPKSNEFAEQVTGEPTPTPPNTKVTTPPSKNTLLFRETPDAASLQKLKDNGYEFIGIDEKGRMRFEPTTKAPGPTPETPPQTQASTQQAPDIEEFLDEPNFARRPNEGEPPEFAFMDEGNFNPPEPFYHLPDGSTVSGRELQRRGLPIPPPATPEFQGQVLPEETQFPQRAPVNPLRPEIPPGQITNQQMGDFLTQRHAQEMAGQEPPQGPQLPPEFQPDIPQTNEPIPELGPDATSPKFGEQVIPPNPDDVSFARQIPDYDSPTFPGEERTNQNPRWVEAQRDAEKLGINPHEFADLDTLEWKITQETARRTFETGINPLTTPDDVMHARVLPFKGARRNFDEIYNDIGNNILERQGPYDEAAHDRYMQEAERAIMEETDPEVIIDNFNNLEQDLVQETRAMGANPDLAETLNTLRDMALDKVNRNGLRKSILTSYDKGYFPDMGDDTLHMREGGPEEEGPLDVSRMADIGGGKVRMDIGDREEMIRIFKQTYKGSIPQVATKELLQNAIDAAKLNPRGQGRAIVGLDAPNKTITVMDNGNGLTRDEISTVYTNLSSSGKRGQGKNVGELGVGKTTYLVTGEHVKITTVAREPNGRLYQHEFEGSPEQIIAGIDVRSSIVPEGTPTGTTVQLKVGPNEKFGDLETYLKHFESFSNSPVPVEIQNASGHNVQIPANRTVPGRPFYTGSAPGSDFTLSVPDTANWSERDQIKLVLSNRGMMQGVDAMWTGRAVLPDHVLVELDPNVIGTHDDYPLTAPTREALKGPAKAEIQKQVTEHLVKAARKAQEDRLQKAFDSLKPQSGNRHVIMDSGGRYQPHEIRNLATSPEMHSVAGVMNDILSTLKGMFPGLEFETNKFGWLIDSPDSGGINIPNPSTSSNRWAHPKKPVETAILVNPFSAMVHSDNPVEFSDRLVHIIAHEFAHNLARNEGASYTWALAKVLTKFGSTAQGSFANAIRRAVTDASGGYAPRIQELLSEYTISRGRPEVTKDLLSDARKSEFIRDPSRPGGFDYGIRDDVSRASGGTPSGNATTVTLGRNRATPANVKRLREQGFEFGGVDADGNFTFNRGGQAGRQPILETEVGGNRPTTAGVRQQLGKPADKPGTWYQEAANLPRAALATADFSAPLRQGIGLIHKTAFWKALPEMMKSWATEEGFQQSQRAISERPLFRERVNDAGKRIPSFAEDAGLSFSDLGTFSKREENVASTWIEKIPAFGRVARMSNRAYVSFLNNLRAGAFEELVHDFGVFKGEGQANLKAARDIAKFVNAASGRGSLGSLEASATNLNSILFAPRLIASRLQMMGKGTAAVFSPETYMLSNPSIRREYLKSLMAIGVAGNAVIALGKLAGGETSLDPSSSDFMKLRIGNTRLDPWAGFQQYATAFNRLINPVGPSTGFEGAYPWTRGQMVTSSTSGKEYDLWNQRGPYDPNSMEVMGRFARGKVNPIIGFAWSLLSGRKEMTGKSMNFTSWNPLGDRGENLMDNSIAQRFIPIIAQDMYDLAQNDELPPEIKAIVGTLNLFGMSSQTYGESNFGVEDQFKF